MTSRPRASTEEVYARVRADVLSGVYAPGERLKSTPLCEAYGASVSVIRETLSRLTEQGLVESEPRIGFRVRQVSIDDLHQLTSARIDIESLALRYSIERGDMTWESEVVAAHHRMDRTPMLTEDDPPCISDEWAAAHGCFHGALLDGAGNSWLLGMATTLRNAGEFYRRWSQVHEPDRDVTGEHREILEATLARDAERAVRALTQHYQHTADIVERVLTQREAAQPS